MSELIAVDTSVAVPLLVQTHEAHADVVRWWAGRPLALAGHAVGETYSVLTRLPGDLRLEPAQAADLLSARFESPLVLAARTARELPHRLAQLDIAGGAVYDALVALAAHQHEVPLATRDARAHPTYARIGVSVVTAG